MMLDLRLTSEDGETCLITVNGKEHGTFRLPIQQEVLFQAIRYAADTVGIDSHAFLVQFAPVTGAKPITRPAKPAAKRGAISPEQAAAWLAELGL